MPDQAALHKRLLPLLAFGLLLSLYLVHHHLETKYNLAIGPSICSFSETIDCDSVARSPYSEIFYTPIALLSAVFYFFFAVLCFISSKFKDSTEHRKSIVATSILGLVPSLFYLGISFFVIKKICIFCSVLYLISIASFLISYIMTRKDGFGIIDAFSSLMSALTHHRVRLLYSTFGFFVFLFFMQIPYLKLVLAPRYKSHYGEIIMTKTINAWKKSDTLVKESDVQKLPGVLTIGAEHPRLTIQEFFDYECPFCQKVTPILEKVVKKYPDKIQVQLFQFPLDRACNYLIDRDLHEIACEMTVLTLCSEESSPGSGAQTHHRLMEAQPRYRNEVSKIAKDQGLSLPTCEQSVTIQDSIKSHVGFAEKIGITSTPTLFVNGKPFEFESIYQIESLIDRILKEEN